ncbi:MAG TPA: DEAD/DEAH box helicase family protein [Chthoniobacterales bacterium]|nr:DEAD/DEAH box helicase family protein [Chthoniobacterales bacterium]
MASPRTEAETREQIVDSKLAAAGWTEKERNVIDEFFLGTGLRVSEGPGTSEQGREFVDYVLRGADGKPLAVVEAKCSSRDALAGQRQASDYGDRIRDCTGFDPFVFLTNGNDIWFWNRGRHPLRKIAGFFTRDDLERLAFQRQHSDALENFGVNSTIAGRTYQVEAVKRITEAMGRAQRKFLLVMATGTGKTRTVVALIDLLMRAKWIQRVLFLADRRELVRQALGDLKEHLPNETRARIEAGEVDAGARIHIATYPSMMQVYQQLSTGYYDLIIADESHRSIYNRYRALFDHFDSLQLGLTATPTDYLDHNTFDLFECPDGLPTFYYPFEKAVEEGYLVNYRALEAQTSFQLEGIKSGELPPEVQRQLEAQGIDLNEIEFEGSDLERIVTNTGTHDAVVREFMERSRKDARGTQPAKTIIFAMGHRHAVELWQSFNRLYPDLQRQGFAEIIDSHMERADKTLDDFKHRDMPRVAISVDMLDTGIDVPAIQNLVFNKPVFSQVKFWQMIGRGTRLWSDPETGASKADFLIIDHWNNFSYFQMNPEGEVAHASEPLPVRLFRLRLEKLNLLRAQDDTHPVASAVAQLQQMLAPLPRDNVNIRPHLDELAELQEARAWEPLPPDRMRHLSETIAPLLRFLPVVSLAVMTFEIRTEKLAIEHLSGRDIDLLRQQVVEDLRLLPQSLREVQAQSEKIAQALSPAFWNGLTYDRIEELRTNFASLMRFRQRPREELIRLDLPDEIATRRWIIYGPGGEGAYAENYREQVEARVREMAAQMPALAKLQRGESLTDADLQSIASGLNRPDLFISERTLRQVYECPEADLAAFLRHMLGLARLPSREEKIRDAFDGFIAAHPHFSALQIHFLRAVRAAAMRRAKLTGEDLAQLPFSRIGEARKLFSESELTEILDLANRLAA